MAASAAIFACASAAASLLFCGSTGCATTVGGTAGTAIGVGATAGFGGGTVVGAAASRSRLVAASRSGQSQSSSGQLSIDTSQLVTHHLSLTPSAPLTAEQPRLPPRFSFLAVAFSPASPHMQSVAGQLGGSKPQFFLHHLVMFARASPVPLSASHVSAGAL